MKYNFTGYRVGDENEIARLFQNSFGGRKMNLENWRIVHEKGNADHYCLANMWDGEKLIGHTELFTAQATYCGKQIVSGTSGTTMADPDYLGAGAMVYKWIDKTYPDYIKIGFPNENSFPLVMKVLKHKYLGEIDFWWRKINNAVYEENKEYRIRQCDQVSTNLDFRNECMKYQYSLIRDASFLRWRFLDRKSRNYKYYEMYSEDDVLGYMVCSVYEDADETVHGQIVDIMAKSADAFANFIEYALDYYRNIGAEIVKIWVTDPTYVECLESKGFSYGLRPFHMECWHHEIDMKKSYITMADSDIF